LVEQRGRFEIGFRWQERKFVLVGEVFADYPAFVKSESVTKFNGGDFTPGVTLGVLRALRLLSASYSLFAKVSCVA
jgi:hypothetical protein